MSKLAVIALGGNALLRDNEAGTIDEQEENAFKTMENLIFLLKDGYNLVITHGNGPQVGNTLFAQRCRRKKLRFTHYACRYLRGRNARRNWLHD